MGSFLVCKSLNMTQELKDILIGDIPVGEDALLTVNRKEPISSVLKTIQTKDIRSIAVVDDEGDCVLGLVSAYDIMTYICFGAYKFDEAPDHVKAVKSLDTPIEDITKVFHEETSKVWNFSCDQPLSALLDAFSEGVHQAVLVRAGKFQMISQHDIVKYFIGKNLPEANKTLAELGFGSAAPEKLGFVESNRTALFAFRRMEMKKFIALAVVEPETKVVVGTISVGDVRGLNPDNLSEVLQEVPKFLEVVRGKSEETKMVCSKDITLGAVMKTLVDSRHKHMWVVDESGRLIDAVSFSDIINHCTATRHNA